MRKSIISVFMSIFFTVLFLNTQSYAANKDGMLFNPVPVTVYTEAVSGGGVPVGTIIAWPVATNPSDWDKWLECNGQSITSTAYPELWKLVGSNVPDYRGLFLRGYGGNSSSLGYAQGDAIRNIYGTIHIEAASAYHQGVFYPIKGGDGGYAGGGRQGEKWGIDASLVVPTANENRPVNKAVRYLIRAKS